MSRSSGLGGVWVRIRFVIEFLKCQALNRRGGKARELDKSLLKKNKASACTCYKHPVEGREGPIVHAGPLQVSFKERRKEKEKAGSAFIHKLHLVRSRRTSWSGPRVSRAGSRLVQEV